MSRGFLTRRDNSSLASQHEDENVETVVDLLSAATCTDRADKEVAKAAADFGLIAAGERSSCLQARQAGGCAISDAEILCPVTCELCSTFALIENS